MGHRRWSYSTRRKRTGSTVLSRSYIECLHLGAIWGRGHVAFPSLLFPILAGLIFHTARFEVVFLGFYYKSTFEQENNRIV
jgi:hypothetical protein